ncbi:MAG TPA: hypothetical protein VHE14_05010 [Solirubrobacteraceae bacterium]|nr:hypothetical protein [Solirubrobacteraceae bacterium]
MPDATASLAQEEVEQPIAVQPARRLVVIGSQAAPARPPRLVEIQRRRPPRRAAERVAYRPDRIALWAVVLGVVLVLAAAASAHGGF